MKRVLLLLLAIALLLPALGVALFYGYENWAGGMAWRKAEAALKAAGEPLDLDALRPGPVPDGDNMAAAPIFRQLFTLHSPHRAHVHDLRLPPPAIAGTKSDSPLVALAQRFRANFSGDPAMAAEVILAGLAPLEPMLEAIRDAAERPAAVWPLKVDLRESSTELPYLTPLRRTAEVLAARAVAAIEEGDARIALADFQLITRLARDANQPPMLAGCLAEQAMLGCALHIVREGISRRAWTADDLALIERELAGFRPVESFADSVRGERAMFLAAPEQSYARVRSLFVLIDFRNPVSEWVTTTVGNVAWSARPSGWLALDQAHYATLAQDWLTTVLRKGFVRPWALDEWTARQRALRRKPADFFRTPVSAFAMATYPPAARTAAYTQTGVDLTRLACAIERYQLAHGRLPASLDALAPEWMDDIPRDAVGGNTYFYRVADKDEFVLYGRGWNARDDGGSNANVNALRGPSSADDWVWEIRPRWRGQAASN